MKQPSKEALKRFFENRKTKLSAEKLTPEAAKAVRAGTARHERVLQSKKPEADKTVYTEIVSERKEDVKVFDCGNGKRKMQLSGKPMHFFDAQSGGYVETDNILIDSGDCFENAKAGFKAKFSKNPHGGKLMDMEKDGHRVSLELLSCIDGNCTCKNAENSSEVCYEEILPNTDIIYETASDRIKESIVVKAKQESYVYSFKLKTENLKASLSAKTGKISLKNPDGKEIFSIPAPYMFDTNENISTDVKYSLKGGILTVTADPEWINAPERVFPITIDPTIELSSNVYCYHFGMFYGSYMTSYFSLNSSNLVNYLALQGLTSSQIDSATYKLVIGTLNEEFAGSRLIHPDFGLVSKAYALENEEIAFDITPLVADRQYGTYDILPPFDEEEGSYYGSYGYISYSAIYVEYSGTTLPVLSSITIPTPPSKTVYTAGEYFSTSGMVVKAIYSDGTSQTVTGYTYSPSGALNTSNSYVTISYQGKTATQNITVTQLTEIEITLPYRTVYYVNEGFDPIGMTVSAKYSDETFRKLNSSDYTLENTGPYLSAGIQTIKVRYQSLIKTLNITIYSHEGEPAQETESFKRDSTKAGQPEISYTCGTGASSVNLFSGRLLYESHDTNANSGLQISHVFNSKLNNSLLNNLFAGVGKNWKLNIHQALLYVKGNSKYPDDVYYVYIDASGIEHEFVESGLYGSTQVYHERDNFGLKLVDSVITDANKNKYYFTSGLLTKIEDIYGKKINISYGASNKINKVTDTRGQEFVFSYNSVTGMLSTISASESVTVFQYGSGTYCRWLMKIITPDGGVTDFAYTTNSYGAGAVPYLCTVTDPSGCKLDFEHNGSGAGRKTISISESAVYTTITGSTATSGEMTNGKSTAINYLDKNTTIIKNEKNVRFRYIFDNTGKVNASYEETAGETSISAGYTTPAAKINYTGNFSAQISDNGRLSGNWSKDITFGVNAGGPLYQLENPLIGNNCEMHQEITNFSQNNTYVMSGFGKVEKTANGRQVVGFGMKVVLSYSTSSGLPDESFIFPFSTDAQNWQFGAIAFRTKFPLSKITTYCEAVFEGGFPGTDGKALFSNVRITKAETSIGEIKIYDKSSFSRFYSAEDIDYIFFYDRKNIPGTYPNSSEGFITMSDLAFICGQAEDCSSIYMSFNNGAFKYEGGTNIRLHLKDGTSLYLDEIGLANIVESTNIKGVRTQAYTLALESGKTLKHIINYPDSLSNTKTFIAYSYLDAKDRVTKTEDFRGLTTEYEYDSTGNICKTTTFHPNSPENNIVHECSYDSGRLLTEEIGERRYVNGEKNKTSYEYDAQKGLLNSITAPNSQVYSFEYNPRSNTLASIFSTAAYKENRNSFGYNKNYLTSLSNAGSCFDFEYDGFGRPTKMSVNGNILLNRRYGFSVSENTVEDVYNNKSGYEYIKKHFDKYGRFEQETCKENGVDVVKAENIYGTGGRLEKHIDKYADLVYNYEYDSEYGDIVVRVLKESGALNWSANYSSDNRNRLESANYNVGVPLCYRYAYSEETQSNNPADITDYPDNRLSKLTLATKFDAKYYYDALGRRSKKVFASVGAPFQYTETYSYLDAQNTSVTKIGTTGFVKSIYNSCGQDLRYVYDRSGNIQIIYKNSAFYASYEYDGLNRLTNETLANGIITSWTYDAGGNILTKTVNGVTKSYGYSNSGWKDQLVSYNGQSIDYDSMGNPLNYLGASLVWTRGRMLDTWTKNGTDCSFDYDASGKRIKKIITKAGITTEFTYLYADGRLMREWSGTGSTAKRIFYYDADGVCGFNYNGQDYYFVRNLQGDILEIYDSNFNKVAAYSYDAWGNHTINLDIGNVGTINPFRYRGYYYDTETGLYYLQSRYYDPQTGRFINADDVAYLEPTQINGLNLYAYCLNNPVMYTDSTGYSWWEDWGEKALGWVATGVLVVGAIVAIGLVAVGTVASGGLLAAVLVGAGVGALAGVGGSIIAQGGFAHANPWSVFTAGLIGGAIGAISGIASFGLAQAGQIAGQAVGLTLNKLPVLAPIASKALTATLASAGWFLGGIAGGAIGGMATNYVANKIVEDCFGSNYVVDNPNWARSSLLNLFKWLQLFL